MSVWLRRSRATVAFVSGVPDSRLMIASRVHVTWSSQSFRMFVRRSIALALSAGDAWAVAAVAWAWWPAAPWACAIPLDTASAASALKKATSAVSASGIGREVRAVFKWRFLSLRRGRPRATAAAGWVRGGGGGRARLALGGGGGGAPAR